MSGSHILNISVVVITMVVASSGCVLELGEAPFLCNKGGNPECPDGYECRGVTAKNKFCCVQVGAELGPGCTGTTVTCNNNGKCESGENTANCPKDCPKKTTDGGPKPEGTKPPPDGNNPPPPDQFVPPPDQFKPPPDTKPPLGGFGAKCNKTFPCSTAYQCVTVGTGTVDGFCTKKCYNSGGACTGMPTGTGAYCLLSNSAKTEYYCAFLCKLGTQTWKCPSTLKCDPVENPPGSGQYVCLP